MSTHNDFFGAAPVAPAVETNTDNIDLFAQAIAGRFTNTDRPMLTARLTPVSTQHAGSSTLRYTTHPHPSSTATTATPLPRLSINRSTSPHQPIASSSASSSDFTVVTAATVSDILRTPNILVLDIRPHSAYSAARLPHAISLSVPSTLLKRPAFTLQKLAAMLPSASARIRFQSWSKASRILVYDADSTTLTEGSNLLGLLRKFRTAGYSKDVAWLQGGIQALWRDNRHLVEERALSEDEEEVESQFIRPRGLPQAAFQQTTSIVRPSPGSLTMPPSDSVPPALQSTQSSGGSVRLAAANPFYDNIRQNMELSQGITERIPLRLSPSIAARLKELPFTWLRDIAKSANHDDGADALAMQFYRIELSEQRRLQGIMSHHSMQSSVADASNADDSMSENKKDDKPFPYSIVAGVEKGTKNRYRNIWPFEHSRVRLKDQVQDDYVNASFVQPLGTRRKFIATQGPLPSTFSDFWSVVWQQDVRIILMLTKEFEGGSIKCGKYWADGQYGSFRLKCISVSGAKVQDDPGGNEASSIFFHVPPKEDANFDVPEDNEHNFTIRRVFELSHCDHPESFRTVTHLQYLGWPDMDVPVNPRSLLRLMFEVDEMADRDSLRSGDTGKTSPVLLHCSAGVGRTGAFIMIDAALDGVKQEIRKRAMAQKAAHPIYASASGSSESDGEGQSDSDDAMDVDNASFIRELSMRPVLTSEPSALSKSTILPRTPHHSSAKKDLQTPVVTQSKAWPVATLHLGNSKSGHGDIHVPLVPSDEAPGQRKALPTAPKSSAGPLHPSVGSGDSLLKRRLSRQRMQRPVTSDFTVADADSMFMSPTPNPAFAMDVNTFSQQTRNSNSSSGEGTGSSGDKASGSASSGSASDGRVTGSMQKAFSHMSSTDDSSGSPDRLSRFRHRLAGSDGTGSGEGAGGSASESSALGSKASGSVGGGYSSSSSVGLGSFSGMAVASPELSSGYSSPVRQPVTFSGRGRNRPPMKLPMQKPSLLAPKPLHLKPQMPELTEGVETHIQSSPGPLPTVREVHGGGTSIRSNLSSSSSFVSSLTDTSSLRSTSLSGHTTDDTPASMHKSSRSPSVEKASGLTSDQSAFNYAEPRELHGDDSPPLLSSLEEPIRQILEDMREQRMSLCQSLRQYVFVHTAIIEGALIIAEEERKRLGQHTKGVFDPDSPPLSIDIDVSKVQLPGKRGASPTELPKEDKKGDVALVKRPSVKRGKSVSGGESASTASS